MYNHIEYCSNIARRLIGVDTFMESMGDELPNEVDERLSRLSGTVMVAVDNDEESFSINNDAQMIGRKECAILILSQAEGSSYLDVRAAVAKSSRLIREVMNRLIQDVCSDDDDTMRCIDVDSLTIGSAGPYADNMYGSILTYDVTLPKAYTIDGALWR